MNSYVKNELSMVALLQGIVCTIKNQWKDGKQTLLAVCNKLLKQVFAVAKNKTIF